MTGTSALVDNKAVIGVEGSAVELKRTVELQPDNDNGDKFFLTPTATVDAAVKQCQSEYS